MVIVLVLVSAIISVLLALVPVGRDLADPALYRDAHSGAQAFQTTPVTHTRPAIVLAPGPPSRGRGAKTLMDGALRGGPEPTRRRSVF